ncbi:MAG: FRG domain-containing protein [Opitutales bacterium]|nr:FRG domain-containing protein [Opitutales bacterium]
MSENMPEPEGSEPQSTDYFEQIPIWTNDASTKRFEVLSDKISGRIPVTRVEHWQNFASLLDDPFFNPQGVHLVYRGHRRFDWELTPTLGRLSLNGIVTQKLAETQLSKFRKAIRGRVIDRGLLEQDDEWQNDELWSVGQHHGLMTPLLDWTYSPFVGLFFAFAGTDVEGEKENPFRAVYVLNKSFVEDDDQCPDIRVIEPRKDDHGRLVNQAGLFTFSPFDATIENKLADLISDPEFGDEALREASEDEQPEQLAKYICKIYIRNEERDGCLKYLRRMNVHHASLFPDLIGASDYCNILTAEEEKEKRLVEARLKEQAKAEDPTRPLREIPEEDTEMNEVSSASGFEAILRAPEEASQVEPGRIPVIVDELEKTLAKEKVVDWKDRESAQARMRVQAKFVLRKYGYPASVREEVADKLIQSIVVKEEES